MKVKRPNLTLLKKIFLVDLIKGLFLTFSYQRPSLNYTEQYPKVRPKVAERFRGAPRLNNDPENGETLCIACNLCALACPEHCIEVGWERDSKGKKVLTTYVFDISRCMFCGLCEDACGCTTPMDAAVFLAPVRDAGACANTNRGSRVRIAGSRSCF